MPAVPHPPSIMSHLMILTPVSLLVSSILTSCIKTMSSLMPALVSALMRMHQPIREMVVNLRPEAEEERSRRMEYLLEEEALEQMMLYCGTGAGAATHDTRNLVRCL